MAVDKIKSNEKQMFLLNVKYFEGKKSSSYNNIYSQGCIIMIFKLSSGGLDPMPNWTRARIKLSYHSNSHQVGKPLLLQRVLCLSYFFQDKLPRPVHFRHSILLHKKKLLLFIDLSRIITDTNWHIHSGIY